MKFRDLILIGQPSNEANEDSTYAKGKINQIISIKCGPELINAIYAMTIECFPIFLIPISS